MTDARRVTSAGPWLPRRPLAAALAGRCRGAGSPGCCARPPGCHAGLRFQALRAAADRSLSRTESTLASISDAFIAATAYMSSGLA